MNKVLWSKKSDEWSTPQDLYNTLNEEFHFTCDMAASLENRKIDNYWGPDHQDPHRRNSLVFDWGKGPVWLNPPYSQCKEFIAKAYEQQSKGSTTVTLVPSRTDTKWWHAFIWDQYNHKPWINVQLRFIKGRLKFGDSTNSAPFPSVIVVFKGA